MNKEISIIISTKNRPQYLKILLDSINNQKGIEISKIEIVIIDNGSIDDTKEVIDNEMHKIKYEIIYCKEIKPGLLNARHKGIKQSKGSILIFLDDDVIVSETWLLSIIDTFKNTDAVLVGGKVLPKWEIEPPGWINNFWRKIEYGNVLCELSLNDFGNDIKEVDPIYIFGCNYSIKRDVLIECGGFHPDAYPNEMMRYRGDGEWGLSVNLRIKKLKAIYNPLVAVYHFIPKERLTVEYFCKRAFMQGISDSYTDMRRRGGIEDPIRLKVRDAYKKGIIFHREEVLKDDELLAWVLHDTYLEDFEYKHIQFEQYNKANKTERYSYYKNNYKPYILSERIANQMIEVEYNKIDITNFLKWMSKYPELSRHYSNMKDVQIEKIMEHYLTFNTLEIKTEFTYIDIAAAGSPWVNILIDRGYSSAYQLDISYPEGIIGRRIGADAGTIPFPDASVDALALHCSFECFQNESDIKFIKEAKRILKPGGKLAIVPLYIDEKHMILTSPFCDQRKVNIDPEGIKVWREDKYRVHFSRHYSPETLKERVFSKIYPLNAKVIYYDNISDIAAHFPGQRIYCHFMLLMEKI